MIVLDASVVIVALPSAQRALHISIANRQWVMSAYTLAFGSLLLLGGRIADYLGRRRMFVIGLIGFGAASALGGLAQNAAMLFGARALQGAFAAVMAPASLSLLTVTFTEAAASGPGPSASTAPSPAAGPRSASCSAEPHPVRLVALDAADQRPDRDRGGCARGRASSARAGPRSRTGYDLPGAVTVTVGFFLLVYGFTMAGTARLGAPLTLALLLGAAAALVAFVVIELRVAAPAAAAARGPRPQPRRLVPGVAAGR